jgi:hypothetical protein
MEKAIKVLVRFKTYADEEEKEVQFFFILKLKFSQW